MTRSARELRLAAEQLHRGSGAVSRQTDSLLSRARELQERSGPSLDCRHDWEDVGPGRRCRLCNEAEVMVYA